MYRARTRLTSLIFSRSFVAASPSQSQQHHHARQQVKKHLRRLYQHIHPDRLVQHPQQRLINESSFQQLQSALDQHLKPYHLSTASPYQANAQSSLSAARTPPRKLTFFANRRDGAQGLIKAHINFHESRIANAVLDLFHALNLDDPPSQSILYTVFPHSKKNAGDNATNTSASSFDIRTVAEQARKQRNPFSADPETAASMANATTTPDEKRILLHAMQRKYGISIELHENVTSHTLLLLRRLAGVLSFLDENNVSIRPAVIILDAQRRAETVVTKTNMKNGGKREESAKKQESLIPIVRLGALAPDDEWRAAVESQEVSQGCEKARAEIQQLHVLQVIAAKVIGVRLMLCEVSIEAARTKEDVAFVREYEMLLRKILTTQDRAHDINRQNNSSRSSSSSSSGNGSGSGSGTAKEQAERMRGLVAMMITKDGQVEMEEKEGMIKVGLQGGVESIEQAVVDGAAMAKRFARDCARREEDAKVTEAVRRDVRLARLRRLDGISDAEWRAALNKLRRHRGKLKDSLMGVSVAIGSETRLLSGGEVEVAHDFDIGDFV